MISHNKLGGPKSGMMMFRNEKVNNSMNLGKQNNPNMQVTGSVPSQGSRPTQRSQKYNQNLLSKSTIAPNNKLSVRRSKNYKLVNPQKQVEEEKWIEIESEILQNKSHDLSMERQMLNKQS